ncbi:MULTISPECIES: cytochrome c peroxidase [unclassified Pseudoalteromonas]|uniref:cytochrome-c peroxidase n=1 Tax=unclassified Pseudoalteromonas TaxID=194690 RepID=UPI002097E8B7|nr:cytochrome c peroxidase [Pseudoalteromonas sp. XMcav2-N]MCO7188925.1 c-type cytochrome [Pseudoalteromonas sp. XMcav2-N]
MSTNYVVIVFGGLAAVFLSLAVQFYLYDGSRSRETAVNSSIELVTYSTQWVDAAIQPLPRIEQYDVGWVQLGKALFKSPLLSADNTTSCASCHDLYNGGDDGFPVSVGINQQLGSRNAPSVINAVFNFRQFWDGRSVDLTSQLPLPIHNPLEMASNWSQVIAKLQQQPHFVSSFSAVSDEGITPENITKAIVAFQMSLVSENTPIDAYLLGDMNALTAQQQRGYRKFVELGCVTCHQGRNIGGNIYQKMGRLERMPNELLNDFGRYQLTRNEQDKFVFKVPSLRNVANTQPYFHNGSVANLSDAIRLMARGQLGLELSEEDIADLEALLHAFSGELPRSLKE